MKRLLVLPAVAAVCTVEVWRRGLAWPVLGGARAWVAACGWRTSKWTEPDPIG